MKIYAVLWNTEFDGSGFVGVYSSEELAKNIAKEIQKGFVFRDYYVEECELDKELYSD